MAAAFLLQTPANAAGGGGHALFSHQTPSPPDRVFLGEGRSLLVPVPHTQLQLPNGGMDAKRINARMQERMKRNKNPIADCIFFNPGEADKCENPKPLGSVRLPTDARLASRCRSGKTLNIFPLKMHINFFMYSHPTCKIT